MSKRTLTPDKYLSKGETKQLFEAVRAKALVDIADGRMTWDKIWMMIHTVFNTGLRVSELADLKVGHIHLGQDPYVKVVNGKGGNSRKVLIQSAKQHAFRKHIKEFIGRYGLSPDDYLMNIKGKPYSKMGLQKQFKRAVKEAGLPDEYSIHCARHTFAVYLYDRQKSLRMVQQQLGHADPGTTAIYAQATKESTYEAMNGLYD